MLDALLNALRQIFPISGFTVMAVLFVIFGWLLLRVARFGIGLFIAMWQPIVTVHNVGPSATDRVAGGMFGCLLWIPTFFFGWGFIISGILLLIFQEGFVMFVSAIVTQVFGIEL